MLCSLILCRAVYGLDFREGGVAYFKDGQVRASYAAADGLGEGRVDDLQLDRDGTLWAATEGGLSRVKNGRVATLTSKNGLPCDTVHWVMEDDDHSFWLYMACGLVRIARPELDAWVADPKRTIQATVFDSSDGVRSHAIVCTATARMSPSPRMENCGSLPCDGVSVIDPRHLPFNKLPPPVHIEQITADRKTYESVFEPAPAPADSRSGDRLYRSQPGRAGEDPLSRQAGRPGSRLAGRRQSPAGVL